MFSTSLNKIMMVAIAVLFAGCATLGTLLYISNQKVISRNATIVSLNSSIEELNNKISSLNLLVKHNDEIATKTINSLNDTISQCQRKQDEIISFCDKRVQLALESKEVDVVIEEMANGNDSVLQEIDKIKGIDQNSSNSYIEELNKMIYGFGK